MVEIESEKTMMQLGEKIGERLHTGDLLFLSGDLGAGKTTLSLCLNGLIPQLLEGKLSGQITVAGLEVSKTPVQFLAKILGLVLQDSEAQIIGRTVEEDTAFGPRNFLLPPEEIQRRVEQALAKVRLHGYNQRLTQELSGGEKQRVSIARAIYKDAPILILDEATSALDSASEVEVQRGLDRLMEGRTTFVIAHRLSTVAKADRILVMEKGRVVETGTHEELLKHRGTYFKFCELQNLGN